MEQTIPRLLWPVNQLLALLLRRRVTAGSVLHVCYPVHLIHYMVDILRANGCTADYVAVGTSQGWNECDYHFQRWRKWMPLALTEFWFFWRVMSRYEVIHMHFMQGISRTGWEWPVLKRLGRKIVVYYSGCEARDSTTNQLLHPDMNICQDCDYQRQLCDGDWSRRHRALTKRFADLELVTTPDLLDFCPGAIHFPFFCPPDAIVPTRQRQGWPENGCMRIVHITNHPGIEGTAAIRAAVERLKSKGWPVEFRHLSNTAYRQVLQELADADLSVGKMKMGYYANAQVESMRCGTPAVTHVRPEFMTDDLRASALLLTDLGGMEAVLERMLDNPALLAEYRHSAASSIQALHDNQMLAKRLIAMYRALVAGRDQQWIAENIPGGLCPGNRSTDTAAPTGDKAQ
ncbi:hypothetical protein A6A05_00500 [Magnetospirillum moscoviense]|uniref:Glycosyltransferase n=1 Tax=Magnetospirillum moscoviense TaxID=1437059 RepID=A0A178MYZ1_9PROT|nr:hypothetical protein A6A05_00500 [Magnetospirillum moscoviense]